jgi:hypothetical protein
MMACGLQCLPALFRGMKERDACLASNKGIVVSFDDLHVPIGSGTCSSVE